MIFEAITLDAVNALGIARVLSKLAKKLKDVNRRKEIGLALRSLKELYFFQDQSLEFLERIIRKENLTEEEFGNFETDFGDYTPEANGAIKSLNDFAKSESDNITLKALAQLRGLRSGKLGARASILYFFGEAGEQIRSSGAYDKEKLAISAEAVKAIVIELNAQLEDVDTYLRGLIEKDAK